MSDIPVTGGGTVHVPSRLISLEYKMLENGTEIVRLEITRPLDTYSMNQPLSDDDIKDALKLAGRHLGVQL